MNIRIQKALEFYIQSGWTPVSVGDTQFLVSKKSYGVLAGMGLFVGLLVAVAVNWIIGLAIIILALFARQTKTKLVTEDNVEETRMHS